MHNAQLLVLSLALLSCRIAAETATPKLPATPFNYAGTVLPNHFLTNGGPGPGFNAAINLDNTPLTNPTTDHGATLGRVLFYEKKLSLNGTIACASCHVQSHGFADPNRFSSGFLGGLTARHSMGLANSRFYARGRFFWDERAATLEAQTLTPIQDQVEMGLTLTQLQSIVAAEPYYQNLFVNAFGDSAVTSDRISRALAQFVRSMVSINSRYDQARVAVNNAAAPFPGFTASENLGKSIFMNAPNGAKAFACINCHQTEAFVGGNPSNNGLDAVTTDRGVGGITNRPNDESKFKVPSLRNIAIRAPFMHDGRFATLEEVVEHYNSGIQDHPNLDRSLVDANGAPKRLNLTQVEKTALVDFMKTLTDQTLLTDVKFSDPFADRWSYYYNLANSTYVYFSGNGDSTMGLAYYYYFRAYGDLEYFTAYGFQGYAKFKLFEGVAYFYYNYLLNTHPKYSAYILNLYLGYAYYLYLLDAGDTASANSVYYYYYTQAIAALYSS